MTVTFKVITPLTKQILKSNDDSFTDGDSIISSHYDTLEQYYPIHNHTQDKEDFVCNNSPQQPNVGNRFQVMLHDLIMKHKASLQMFDDVCNLVLQSRKSFLRSVEGSYCTYLLRPYN